MQEENKQEVTENTPPETAEEEKPEEEPQKEETSETINYKAELEKREKELEDARFAVVREKKKKEDYRKKLEEAGIETGEKEGLSEETVASIVDSRLEKLEKSFTSKLGEIFRAFKSKENVSNTPGGAGQKPLPKEEPHIPSEEDKKILKKHSDWVWDSKRKKYLSPKLEEIAKRYGRDLSGIIK